MSGSIACLVIAGAAIAFGLLITHLAMLATTIYLHRPRTRGHHVAALGACREPSRIWITTALKPRQWARDHRLHHAAEDTPDDPTARPTSAVADAAAGTGSGATHRCTPKQRVGTRPVDKCRDLTADKWDRWFFDCGNLGLVIASHSRVPRLRTPVTRRSAERSASPSASAPGSSR